MKERKFIIGVLPNVPEKKPDGIKAFAPIGVQFTWHKDGTWGVQIFLIIAILQFGWFDLT